MTPDAPVNSVSLPRGSIVTAKDGTLQAYEAGTYAPTSDVTSLYSTLSGKSGYLYLGYDGENTTPTTASPALLPYEACLIVTGAEEAGTQPFQIDLDGIYTGIGNTSVAGKVPVYDISGRKVTNGLSKGIYIINGRKMMIN